MSEDVDLSKINVASSPLTMLVKEQQKLGTLSSEKIKQRTNDCLTNNSYVVKGLVSNEALLLGTVVKVALNMADC